MTRDYAPTRPVWTPRAHRVAQIAGGMLLLAALLWSPFGGA